MSDSDTVQRIIDAASAAISGQAPLIGDDITRLRAINVELVLAC